MTKTASPEGAGDFSGAAFAAVGWVVHRTGGTGGRKIWSGATGIVWVSPAEDGPVIASPIAHRAKTAMRRPEWHASVFIGSNSLSFALDVCMLSGSALRMMLGDTYLVFESSLSLAF